MKKEILYEWNPWWEEKFAFEGIKRELFKKVKNWIKRKEIISIVGSRRAGKTTLFYETIDFLINDSKINSENILFIKADDDRVDPKDIINEALEEYKKDKIPKEPIYVFIDEIQEVDNWQKTLKRLYDLDNNLKIFISGSNSFLLKRDLGSLLAGRFVSFEVFPFTFKEILKLENLDSSKIKNRYLISKILEKYFKEGSFPEILLEKDKKLSNELLKFYFDSIFYRDIIKKRNIRNPAKMENLIKIYLQNLSNLVNFSKIGKNVGLSVDSVVEYTKYLEEAYLIFSLQFFDFSYKKQIINPKKIYCIDNGLRNNRGFKFSKDEGRLAENSLFLNLRQKYEEIFYWHNKSDKEVDFVVKENYKITAINISYTDDIPKREIDALISFKESFKNCKKLILITKSIEKEEKIENQIIKFIPLWKFLIQGA